jgi:hypothetical protein
MDKQEELHRALYTELYRHHRELPNILPGKLTRAHVEHLAWHFTSLASAVEILLSGDIWLTNAAFLNDQRELRHARAIVDEAVGKFSADKEFALAVLDIIERESTISSTYVFSMCCGRDVAPVWDQLSQWRAYGQNGRGVAIGFNFQGVGGVPLPVRLGEVWYDPDLHRKIVDMVLIDGQRIPRGGYWSRDETIEGVASFFMTIAPLMKDPGFKEENELRITYQLPATGGPKVRFRYRDGIAIPYVSLRDIYEAAKIEPPCRYGPMEIKAMAVGPSEDNELWVQTLGLAAAQIGVSFKIEKSRIPYRVL